MSNNRSEHNPHNHDSHDLEEERLKKWLKRGHDRQFREQMRAGTRLLQERKPKEALPLLKRAHEIQPGDMDAALNLSSAYIMAGWHKMAVPVLEEAVQRHPDNPRLWINLGAAYLGNPLLASDDEQVRAITAFRKALQVDPFAPSAAYNIGLIYVDRDERAEAIAAFQLAARSDPGDMDARRMLKKLSGDGDTGGLSLHPTN